MTIRASLRAAFVSSILKRRMSTAPYVDLMASVLEACRRGEIKRLAIMVPPRSSKSLLASVALPGWLLGHNPAEIICVSYSQDLSETFARQTRRVMLTPWYQALFRTRLASRTAVADFMTTSRAYGLRLRSADR